MPPCFPPPAMLPLLELPTQESLRIHGVAEPLQIRVEDSYSLRGQRSGRRQGWSEGSAACPLPCPIRRRAALPSSLPSSLGGSGARAGWDRRRSRDDVPRSRGATTALPSPTSSGHGRGLRRPWRGGGAGAAPCDGEPTRWTSNSGRHARASGPSSLASRELRGADLRRLELGRRQWSSEARQRREAEGATLLAAARRGAIKVEEMGRRRALPTCKPDPHGSLST